MIDISKGEIILECRPECKFENEGVLNPACVDLDGITHMFYRAVSKGNFSTIGYCQIKNDQVIYRSDKPVLVPEFRYESHGVEDPRITFLEGKYYMLYTAYDGQSATVAYAVSNDLKKWDKKGLISSQMTYDKAEDIFRNSGVKQKYTFFEKLFRYERSDKVKLWGKDAMLFPKKIKGKYALMHRILPGIQICYFDDFEQLKKVSFWKNYFKDLNDYVVLSPKYNFEEAYIGGGVVPIETDDGWLVIYHGVKIDDGIKTYSASAALLDKDNPQKVIGRLNYPLFYPKEKWELEGVVNNVVFPTGISCSGDKISIFYGAADTKIGIRKLLLSELLKELKK
jgi:beta-1,2-mannobiose phosphorylase / 1,2-beta-oligomannan phosphorylase